MIQRLCTACFIAYFTVSSSLVIATTEVADSPLPIPTREQLEKSSTLMRQIYEEELKTARTKVDKSRLANRWIDESVRNFHPVDSYTMLQAASRLAATSADVDTTVRAAQLLSRRYEGEQHRVVNDALLSLKTEDLSGEQASSWVDHAIQCAQQAMAARDHACAADLMAKAKPLAKKARIQQAAEIASRIGQLAAELATLTSEAKKAKTLLLSDDSNSGALITLGKAAILLENDAVSAYKHFSRSSASEFKIVGELSLLPDLDTEQQIQLADAWRQISDTNEGALKRVAATQSLKWYEKASASTTGLELLKLQKQMKNLNEMIRRETGSALLLSSEIREDKMRQLLNGRDLDGWFSPPGMTVNAKYADGVLTLSGVPRADRERDFKYLFTTTSIPATGVRIRAEMRTRGRSVDSGLFFCCDTARTGLPFQNGGYEVQISDGSVGEVLTLSGGKVSHIGKRVSVPVDDWFIIDIVVLDRRVTVKVNGIVCADFTETDPRQRFQDGRVVIQQGAGTIQIRSISFDEIK